MHAFIRNLLNPFIFATNQFGFQRKCNSLPYLNLESLKALDHYKTVIVLVLKMKETMKRLESGVSALYEYSKIFFNNFYFYSIYPTFESSKGP